ncbi:MAG: hypothetical protein ABW278_10410 [Steroidobacteraceae bacterium]
MREVLKYEVARRICIYFTTDRADSIPGVVIGMHPNDALSKKRCPMVAADQRQKHGKNWVMWTHVCPSFNV